MASLLTTLPCEFGRASNIEASLHQILCQDWVLLPTPSLNLSWCAGSLQPLLIAFYSTTPYGSRLSFKNLVVRTIKFTIQATVQFNSRVMQERNKYAGGSRLGGIYDELYDSIPNLLFHRFLKLSCLTKSKPFLPLCFFNKNQDYNFREFSWIGTILIESMLIPWWFEYLIGSTYNFV